MGTVGRVFAWRLQKFAVACRKPPDSPQKADSEVKFASLPRLPCRQILRVRFSRSFSRGFAEIRRRKRARSRLRRELRPRSTWKRRNSRRPLDCGLSRCPAIDRFSSFGASRRHAAGTWPGRVFPGNFRGNRHGPRSRAAWPTRLSLEACYNRPSVFTGALIPRPRGLDRYSKDFASHG
jgi:hypothetical protein